MYNYSILRTFAIDPNENRMLPGFLWVFLKTSFAILGGGGVTILTYMTS